MHCYSHLVSQSWAENAKRGDNIKTGLKVTSYALNPSRSEQEHVAGCGYLGNEISASIKGGEFTK